MLTQPIVPSNAPAFNPPLNVPATFSEVHSLALELCAAEGLTYSNALRLASDDLEFELGYAERWDRIAFRAGNDDALPF
jgi:hypothetical protein